MTVREGHGYRLETSDQGVTLVVTGTWTDDARTALDLAEADGLNLNYALGFKDTDLAFIQQWPLATSRRSGRSSPDSTRK